MPGLDHIAIWTHQRDALLATLAEVAGMAAVDGYSPGGRVVARGVRFANGPFLDVHQLPGTAPAGPARFLIALRAPMDEIGALADRHGWQVRFDRRAAAPDPAVQPPWSLASFRRGQGLLSQLFAIDYHPGAATLPDYDAPLYDPSGPPTGAARLERVWLEAQDVAQSRATLSAIGVPDGVISPRRERGLRLDLAIAGAPAASLAPVEGLDLAINLG